ncbi:Serine protease snake [Pseudolycoriella hygida]|uniref:Serine protease snake n=1 Tax=Pseudolycoriella hygida TaxID=35572 RepID=A0A9Q0MWJ2_9DIPT|nr:Serine protease snake [Pseudolycoriella hygida]
MSRRSVHTFCMLFYIVFQIFAVDAERIFQKKCEEYGKLVYKDEPSPLLHAEADSHSISKCGIVEVPLIVGGVKAAKNEFPHMAVIGFGMNVKEKDLAWHCGGTLISELFVLTAAHCLNHRERGDAQRVRFGIISLESDSHQEIEIEERISHPEYVSKSKYNDIALLKLVKGVMFNEHVRPACINIDENYEWTLAIATGFGRLTYESEQGSADLMKVQLSNIKDSDCHETYKTFRAMNKGVLKSQFCAGEMLGKKDTCQGDSGGPLTTVLKKPYCMYLVIGITSFGKFCGFENSPGIYTRVASYVDWIEKIVWVA